MLHYEKSWFTLLKKFVIEVKKRIQQLYLESIIEFLSLVKYNCNCCTFRKNDHDAQMRVQILIAIAICGMWNLTINCITFLRQIENHESAVQ